MNIAELVDDLPEEELEKLSSKLEEIEKRAEERVQAINAGRFMAREFVKSAQIIATELEGVKKIPSLYEGFKKMASEGKAPCRYLISTKQPESVDLEKLASADHYYSSGGVVLFKLLGLL